MYDPRTKQRTMKFASLLIAAAAVTTSAFTPHQLRSQSTSRSFSSRFSLFSATMPICIVVEAEIKEDRMDEFLDMIEKNAIGSRAEPGCIRFGK